MSAEEFATAIEPLLPVFTILATGLISILVAWLTAVMTRRSEQAKITADNDREAKRLAHEKALADADRNQAKEVAEQQRADAAAEGQRAAAAEEARRAKDTAELFFGMALYIESQDPSMGDDARFEHYFAERWPSFEIDLRRAAGTLADAQLRNRLLALVSAITDTEVASFHGSNPKGWASWLTDMGADLSMTASRGEEPDSELLERYDSFFGSFTEVNQYREELWETQRSERQDQLRDISRQERGR